MPFDNSVVIAVAGGGKTTRIIKQVLSTPDERAAILTYTKGNTDSIINKFYELNGAIPAHVEVLSWFSFLLGEMARPYRNAIHDRRIAGMLWTDQKSVPYVAKLKTRQFFFYEDTRIYSDKVAHFAVDCNKATHGAVIDRLEERFDHIYVDEVQDLAAYDLEILELLLKSKIKITLVGDPRQATYATNHAALHSAFRGAKIINKFIQWRDRGLLDIQFESQTHRCNQAIADLSDTLYPGMPSTQSKNFDGSGHNGLYVVRSENVSEYIQSIAPQVLRFSKKTQCAPYDAQAKNFGDCKGLTYDHVLIYPTNDAKKWLRTGDINHVSGSEISLAKLYVAITRARHSVAFVMDTPSAIATIKPFQTRP